MSENKTAFQQFYEDQLEYLYRNDVDNLIDDHYNENAELVAFDYVVRGREALKAHFRVYLKNLAGLHVESTDKYRETDDTIFLEASVTMDAGAAKVYDAFVMRDGKIDYHFTGVMSFTPKGA
jgi:hypothetical protein